MATSVRDVQRIARAWGYVIENRAGGHVAAVLDGDPVPVHMRQVGRPKRQTSPKIVKALADKLGLTVDQFLAGPRRVA